MTYGRIPPGFCCACDTDHLGMSCEEFRLKTINTRNTKQFATVQAAIPVKRTGNATSVPPGLQNLEVRVGEDGVWLTFNARSGETATINIGNLVNSSTFSGLVTQVINEWAEDRKEWASRVKT